jgi:hypothetical protein
MTQLKQICKPQLRPSALAARDFPVQIFVGMTPTSESIMFQIAHCLEINRRYFA